MNQKLFLKFRDIVLIKQNKFDESKFKKLPQGASREFPAVPMRQQDLVQIINLTMIIRNIAS